MTKSYLRIILVTSLVSLSACAQQTEVRQMKNEVGSLNKEMTQLTDQTVKLTQQNALNAKSTTGVYLLPGSKTPARLNSQLGNLQMSLSGVTAQDNGSRAMLMIKGESNDPLPAFTGKVEWGQIQGTTDNYQEVNVQSQQFNAPASVLAPSDVSIPLVLSGFSPEQLGFVRIHDIQPIDPSQALPAQ
ncbi:DUF3251 domain-containing protein [Buttiauxella selenatireducens]|uniref:DUF3251 domain-containing protein n=1 Tax=Buttiauxella selenatireducens TaxID=3073902 RepID=A0ABY9S943_9ENTR|nr:DUF3251 domain-containing protein [Buttiauxella sp. R73]WMY73523.1 DUF3251 domain-containing protein [Buttiauxella sp. R73]